MWDILHAHSTSPVVPPPPPFHRGSGAMFGVLVTFPDALLLLIISTGSEPVGRVRTIVLDVRGAASDNMLDSRGRYLQAETRQHSGSVASQL